MTRICLCSFGSSRVKNPLFFLLCSLFALLCLLFQQPLFIIMKGDYDEEEIAVQDAVPVSAYVPSAPMTVPGAGAPAYVPNGPMSMPAAARKVDVVAPSTLAGGYQFHVDAGANQSLLVEVVRVCFGWGRLH
jgi:hypothetical protein